MNTAKEKQFGSGRYRWLAWAAVGVLLGDVCRRTFLFVSPSRAEDFPAPERVEVLDVPVVYYENLSHLTNLAEEFMVYRSAKPFRFPDLVELYGNETIRAKMVDKNCALESAICSPCFKKIWEKGGVQFRTVAEIVGSGREYYASFAKISAAAAAKTWNFMGSGFELSSTSVEHAFFSNLQEPLITAQFHGAGLAYSMAVQLVGSKTWMFIDRDHYHNDWGALSGSGIVLPRRSPKDVAKVYLYVSQPGDVLFFPPSYAHLVYTHAGPNFMINYRGLFFKAFLTQPLTWITGQLGVVGSGIYSLCTGNRVKRHQDDKTPAAQPENFLNTMAFNKLDQACVENGGASLGIDKVLVPILKSRVANTPTNGAL